MEKWINKIKMVLIKGKINNFLCGIGYYTFLFNLKDNIYMNIQNNHYFMYSRGVYLNMWNPNFDPTLDVPSAFHSWVWLRDLPPQY